MFEGKITSLIFSEDYKERFKGEYFFAMYKLGRLVDLLEKWDDGTLDFKPTCPRFIYDMQVKAMRGYCAILKVRAVAEGVKLEL